MIANALYMTAEKWVERKLAEAGMKRHLEKVHGDTIEYWDSGGSLPAIVLIHGFGAESKYQWFKQVLALSKQYRIVMPNLLYFGQTEPTSARYEITDQVGLIRKLKSHLNLDSVALMGVSYGGLISVELTRQTPDEVSKLFVFDAPVKYMYRSDIDRIRINYQVETIEHLFVPQNPEGLKKLFYLATSKRMPLPPAAMTQFYDEFYGKNLTDKTHLIERMIGSIEEYQAKDYHLSVPTMIVWGENDLLIPVDRAKLLRQHIGDMAQLHVIKGAGHMPNLTKKREFNRIMYDFLLKK